MTNCREIPQVKMDFMNIVHCEELTLVDDLNSAVQESITLGAVHSEIENRIQEWVSHTATHFERENRYMREYNFPAYVMHSGEHEQALRNMKMMQISWKKDQDLNKLDSFINGTWRPWFSQHISTMDTMTAQFLSQFNISVEL